MRYIVYSAAVGDDAERFAAACRDRPRRSYRDAAAAAAAAAIVGKSKDADAAPALGRNPRTGVIHRDRRVRPANRPNTDWVSENTGIGGLLPEHVNGRCCVHRYCTTCRRGAP